MITQTEKLDSYELMPPLMRLNAKLKALPAPGHGHGCHNGLLGSANLARRAGLDRASAFCEIRNAIKPGEREVSDTEIWDAVDVAYDETRETTRCPAARITTAPPTGPSFDTEAERRRIVQAGAGWDETKWRNASPTPIPDSPADQTQLVMKTLFQPEEHLFVGERWDSSERVLPVENWVTKLTQNVGEMNPPHVVPNPFTGGYAPKKTGGLSKRCDAAVATHRIAVAEFDDFSRPDQLAFWAGFGHPVVALIDSGGKSIHAWLQVDCANAREWEEKVAQKLYKEKLIPLGVDPSCRNPSRLSRLPGIKRDNGNTQALLYLNKETR